MQVTLTDVIYRASKDPRTNDLQKLVKSDGTPDIEARQAAAATLDAAGLVIDREIDIWGWDPVLVMVARMTAYPGSLTWGPNAFQPNLTAQTDLSKPWPRSVKYSVDATDYPAIASAPPPLPAPHPVGALIGNGVYAVNTAVCFSNVTGQWLYREGNQETAPDGVPVFWHMGFGFAGLPSPMWETAAARDSRLKGQ